MNPVKICGKCGERFRGTAANEMVCARCEVFHCQVPEDIDQEFVKLGTQLYGSAFTTMIQLNDLMNHKSRLKTLQEKLEKSCKSTKEKNRIKREISRLREEQKAMEELMESIKTRLMQVALLQTSSTTKKSTNVPSSVSHSQYSSYSPSSSASANSSPSKSIREPPSTPRSPVKTTPQPQKLQVPVPQPPPQQPQSLPSCLSPVKTTAAKFEEAAKKVNTIVTFAKIPKKPEMNNNDAPVTASSSSDEDDDSGKQVFLTRSNSVRDRVKAYEEIQRRASTGSCDRRPAGIRGMNKTRKSLNVL